MRVRDLNWVQLEKCLESDNRIVFPVGSTPYLVAAGIGGNGNNRFLEATSTTS
jgi:hypothetical protein